MNLKICTIPSTQAWPTSSYCSISPLPLQRTNLQRDIDYFSVLKSDLVINFIYKHHALNTPYLGMLRYVVGVR